MEMAVRSNPQLPPPTLGGLSWQQNNNFLGRRDLDMHADARSSSTRVEPFLGGAGRYDSRSSQESAYWRSSRISQSKLFAPGDSRKWTGRYLTGEQTYVELFAVLVSGPP